jgi:hypothetical protein
MWIPYVVGKFFSYVLATDQPKFLMRNGDTTRLTPLCLDDIQTSVIDIDIGSQERENRTVRTAYATAASPHANYDYLCSLI